MKRRLATLTAVMITVLLTVVACGNADKHSAPSNTFRLPSEASSTAEGTPAAHNADDVTFAQRMIAHHQQAIQMSDTILGKQGIDSRVIDLANKIKAAQGPEIQQMQSWLSQWTQQTTATTTPSSTPTSTMPGMPGHAGMPGMPGMPGMEGMMSEQDMQALQSAQGLEASKLFLTQMIQHHQGAITMAQNEIHSGQYTPAITLAQSIVANQQHEIDTMQTILKSL